MTEQEQQLAREIAEAVLRGIQPRFDGLEDRFARVEQRVGDVEPRVGGIEQSVDGITKRVGGIEQRVDAFESRLTAHFDKGLAGAVAELKHQAQIHKEELKDDVKKAAEGYDATLRKIERELSDLNTKVDNGFRDHALALKNHSKRITELEKR